MTERDPFFPPLPLFFSPLSLPFPSPSPTHPPPLPPTYSYMYWADWGSSPRIERASMDGKNRIVLHSTNIVWPNALTVDYATQYLYWIDAKLDFIEMSFMDGSRRTVLYRETNRHFRPFGLTLFNDKLYMADIDARQIRSFDVRTGTDLEVVYSDFAEPIGVVAVHPVRQPLGENVPCSSIIILMLRKKYSTIERQSIATRFA